MINSTKSQTCKMTTTFLSPFLTKFCKTANQIEQNLFILADLKVIQKRYARIFKMFFLSFFMTILNSKFCPNGKNCKNLYLKPIKSKLKKISNIPTYHFSITLISTYMSKFGYIWPANFQNLVNLRLNFFLHIVGFAIQFLWQPSQKLCKNLRR